MSNRERYDDLVDEQARNFGPEAILIRKALIVVDAKKTGEDFEKDVNVRRRAIEEERHA